LPRARDRDHGLRPLPGLISGHWSRDRLQPGGFRNFAPRFSDDNFDRNLVLVERLRAIAWALSSGGDIVPLVGAHAGTASGSAPPRSISTSPP
jgi:hypothetical protein